jgi:SAM-dependent methyltransferase
MKKSTPQSDNNRITNFYSDLIKQHGICPQAVDWGSKVSQELRFEVLTRIDNLNGKSILDVGCGLGDLLNYLQNRSTEVDYTGYDITPRMIEVSQKRFPHANFQVSDLLAETDVQPQFDYVFASGIFYLRQVEGIGYLGAMVRKMFSLCRKGIAFNTLSILALNRNHDEFYADPSQVLTMCLEITPSVILRHDYLPHDFTVYLYKKEK